MVRPGLIVSVVGTVIVLLFATAVFPLLGVR
jgi:hypothetical protein